MPSIEELLNNNKKKKEEIRKTNPVLKADSEPPSHIDQDQVRKEVEDLIQSNNVMVFSKSYCPYCTQAKMALKSIPNLEYKTIEMNDGEDSQQYEGWQHMVAKVASEKVTPETANNNTMSVPQIFINQSYIGGADDLADMYTDGRLAKLLGRPSLS
ncbi:unnamed protein product [Cylindrotheca closterium]|uniref:Glutaredoxin domain-containing protein n=1 Tax=Cylindrotheca closterium TaxID=2856 RepID=A0AAD2G0H9_9STRA|nr:unnamed protein product [Cylindrotheca closterium]